MDSSTLRHLANVIAPDGASVNHSTRREAALALAVDGAALPVEVGSALDAFLAGDDLALRRVRKAVVRARFWAVGLVDLIELTARLVVEGDLGAEEAAHSLSGVPYPDRDALSRPQQRVLDVADAVVEDEREQFMKIGDDQSFLVALHALLAAPPVAR